MNNNKIDIEKVFKEAFDNYEVNPGSGAWEAIQSKIGANAAASAGGSSTAASTASSVAGSWITSTIIAVTIVAIGVGGYFYLNNSTVDDNTEVIVEQVEIEEQEILSDIETQNKAISIEKNIISNVTADVENDVNIEKKRKASNTTIASKSKDLAKNQSKDTIESTSTEKANNQTADSSGEMIEDGSTSNTSTDEEEHSNSQTSSGVAQGSKENNNEESEVNNQSNGVNEGANTTGNTVAEKEPYSYIPNIFSPNGDGTNDFWEITVENFDALNILVFDINNNIVYKAQDINSPWDGKLMDGRIAPEGVYFYKITIESQGKTYRKTGSVSLKR